MWFCTSWVQNKFCLMWWRVLVVDKSTDHSICKFSRQIRMSRERSMWSALCVYEVPIAVRLSRFSGFVYSTCVVMRHSLLLRRTKKYIISIKYGPSCSNGETWRLKEASVSIIRTSPGLKARGLGLPMFYS